MHTNTELLHEVLSRHPEYYGRKRSRRLRKKLKVGEFIELGLTFNYKHDLVVDDDQFSEDHFDRVDELIENFIEYDGEIHGSVFLGWASACSNVVRGKRIYDVCLIVEFNHDIVKASDIVDMVNRVMVDHTLSSIYPIDVNHGDDDL